MKYVKYTECEVLINEEHVFALNASISANSNLTPSIVYGGGLESYAPVSEMSANLGIEYYVTGDVDNISMLTGDIDCSGKFGGIEFSGAYLNSYQVDIEPYMPVKFSANFVILSGYNQNLSTGSFDSESIELANGAHSLLNNINYSNVGLDNPVSISYSVSCERVPNYEIGNEFPSNVRFGSVSKNLSIAGEDIGDLITYSGKEIAGISIQPKTLNNLSRGQLLECSGVIESQELGVSRNDFVKGSIQIMERVR